MLVTAALIGCSGSDGSKGPPGDNGADGGDGANSTKGDPGADGKDGTDGAKGGPGANGVDGSDGTDGTNGAVGQDGNDVILSETARLGLSISEVPVDLGGLDGEQIESVGRGAYLINAVADCKGCHTGVGPTGAPLFLAGNNDFPIGPFDPSSPVTDCVATPGPCVDGHVYTRNLTPDPVTGMKLSEEQFVTALRTGNDFKDATGGTTLIVMPWAQTRWMTDRDLRDIYHYLRHIPAIENAVQADVKPVLPPPTSPFVKAGKPVAVPIFADGAIVRPLPEAFDFVAGEATALAGETFDTDNVLRGLAISPLNDESVVENLPVEQQALYGRGSYIVNGPGLCNECHTVGGRNQDGTVRTALFLAGGQAFSVPPPLRPILGQVRSMSGNLTGTNFGFALAYSGFVNTLVSGQSFTLSAPYPLGFPMPYDTMRNMTTRDKLAVYTYITTIRSNPLVTGDKAHQRPSRYCTVLTQATNCTGANETCDATTGTCVGGDCDADADCEACQTCTGIGGVCVAENAASSCVLTSF